MAGAAPTPPELTVLASYDSGSGEAGAEIVAFDARTDTMLVTNAVLLRIDIVSLADPEAPSLLRTVDLSSYGSAVQSVAASRGLGVAVVNGATVLDRGRAVFFDIATGVVRSTVRVGVLPDSVTFSADGTLAVVSNEGEPRCVDPEDRSLTTDPTIAENPEGSITLISVRNGGRSVRARQVGFRGLLDAEDLAELTEDGLRAPFWPGSTVAEDLEPEQATIVGDRAYVTLQENNAVAVVDLRDGRVDEILPLGTKDHTDLGEAFDASDKDGGFNQQVWPVQGVYQPDGIASMTGPGGRTLLLLANEGDARAYFGGIDNEEVDGQECFVEEARVKDLTLDPAVFGDVAALQAQSALGRLKVTTAVPSSSAGSGYRSLASFGGRSVSIRDTDGDLVWDSGSMFERIVEQEDPDHWIATAAAPAWATAAYDTRSDDKGPEPEGIVVGRRGGRQYAFVGLERAGGVVVLDVTNPASPTFVQWARSSGDVSPEGLAYVPASVAPGGRALVLVANEISGTTTIFRFD
jgi:hypothetical protein